MLATLLDEFAKARWVADGGPLSLEIAGEGVPPPRWCCYGLSLVFIKPIALHAGGLGQVLAEVDPSKPAGLQARRALW